MGAWDFSPSKRRRFCRGCSLALKTLMTSCARPPPTNAETGLSSLPRFWRKLCRKLESRVSISSLSSWCLSRADWVKSSRSCREKVGRRPPEVFWNSHSARRQEISGVTCLRRRGRLVYSSGSGDVLARMRGEYVSRLVTISITFSFSFFVVMFSIVRVGVS